MRRAAFSPSYRPTASALLVAAGTSAAAFWLAWLLLAPPPKTVQRPAVAVRQSSPNRNDPTASVEQAVAELLRPQNLATALEEAGIAGSEISPMAADDLAETMREDLRIDLRSPDAAGVRTTVIRWVGDPAHAGAPRLLNVLARRLAAPRSPNREANQRQYEAAQTDVKASAEAVELARQRLESALLATRRAAAALDVQTESSAQLEPPSAFPSSTAESEDWALTQQRLSDLEDRRQSLADRLTPEHPEMKALDEKIESLQSSLADRQPREAPPEPIVADHGAAGAAGAVAQERRATAEARQAGQALLAAQQRHETALTRERACWQTLFGSPSQAVAEIEQVATAARIDESGIGWRRGIFSTLTALLCGALTLAVWPAPRLTFGSADEVRAMTRLPVVVVGRSSLN